MEGKEAEQVSTSDSDPGDFIEPEAPGDIPQNSMLVATDSYEDLEYPDSPEFDIHPSGVIHDIVRHASVNEDDTNNDKCDESNEDASSNELSLKDISDGIDECSKAEEQPKLAVEHFDDIEAIHLPEWRNQKKHVFILSAAGKPIYSRHGAEDKLVTIMGVMQALVSFVHDSVKDTLRCIIAGEHKFVFLGKDPLILVCVSRGQNSTQQILLQLNYVYNQILSVLTYSTLHRVFKQRHNYDLRRLLSGAEKFIDNLLNMFENEPSFFLGAVQCLPLDSVVRDVIAQSIVQHAKVKDLVFALILANNKLVTLVRMKKYNIHPMDIHLIINLVNASESFKAAESWTPICLPKFDSSGFLQAHISYLDDSCQTCLLLLSVDRESFFTLSECRNKIKERLLRYNGLKAINNSLTKTSYSIQNCGISDLRHFLYKCRSTAQYTSPELEAPYITQEEQDRLFGIYHYLHHRIHTGTSAKPLKILYSVGPHETLLGWITSGFELYAVFGPLITKQAAIHAINRLLRWIKKEEDRLFILYSVTF